jgi:four helix bundle protein
VEGYGRRRHKADFTKYLVYSHAECDETIVHLDFLFETGSLNDESLYSLKAHYENLSRKMNAYISWVENNWNDFPTFTTSDLKPATTLYFQ